METFSTPELIKKKKLGHELSVAEINWLIKGFTSGEVPDYQMSALAMAIWFRGMNSAETAALTQAMKNSGRTFDFAHLSSARIDKHSTGGVGDKTSLIIGPILAAAKVHLPMIAGRGLGHTGGTLDKLESLPGFRVQLSQKEFTSLIEKKYFALMGQTHDICPADKKLYALRDVTSTVDSLPLICASIMSKKLAEDLTGLVLDVKFGSGAFMKTLADAEALATLLKSTGEKNGLRVIAVLSNMNAPLGRFIGNSVEVKECHDILSNKTCIENDYDYYKSTRDLSLALASHMLFLAEKAPSLSAAEAMVEKILHAGEALAAFENFLDYQGPTQINQLPIANHSDFVLATSDGIIQTFNTEQIGVAGIELGAGRKTSLDKLDYSAGIEVLCHIGMRVQRDQKLFRIFSNNIETLPIANKILTSAVTIGEKKAPEFINEGLPLIAKVLT